MTGAAQITNLSRSVAAELVRREEHNTGSRMAAYERVASMVGVSTSWLRKFISRSPDVTLSIVAALNIRSQYNRVCVRLEGEIANERALMMALQDEYNAAVEALAGTDAPAAKAQADGAINPQTPDAE